MPVNDVGTLTVNFNAMLQAADDVRTCHNALVQDKEGLDQFLSTLRSTWEGGAALSWNQVQTNWNQACDEVNMILLHLYNALEVALGNYQVTERQLEQLWGG
ncbi:MAG TPA: WXG100 family type VII secretion target [Candidatus Dormibacteraeota bacterium]|nr:WXG100 family type VII secretion target [Candidatus Dormibacteraeota bacterium]